MQAFSIAWYERGLRMRAASVAMAALALVIGLGLAYRSPNPSWAGAFAGVAVLGIAVWMLTSVKTHVTLAILMIYLGVADGVIKNMSGHSSATLLRDLLLYGIVIGIVLRRVVRKEPFNAPPLTGWVVAFAAVVAVQIANPGDQSVSHSLASVRPHLEFVPLFFLGYSVMTTKRRIKGFLMIMLAIAACNGVVSLVQFKLSPQQLASWGPGYLSKIEGTAGLSGRDFRDSSGVLRTRPFGLGSDIGFGGIVGMMALPAGLALLSLGGDGRLKFLGGLLAIGAVLAVVTSQQRTAVVGSVVAILAYLLLATSSRRAFRVLTGLAVGLIIGYIAISAVASNSSSSLFSRYSSITPTNVVSTSVNYRSGTLAHDLPRYLVKYPLGVGIGKVGPAGNSAGGTGGSKVYDAESEPNYLVLDLGIPGLLVMMAFQIRLMILSWRVRRFKDTEMRLLFAALAAPLFAMFATDFVGVTTATTPGGPYLWFVAGILSYWLIGKRNPARARSAI